MPDDLKDRLPHLLNEAIIERIGDTAASLLPG
jgi:hypothetical protein